ncbi:hypothetical protein L2E82_24999 [Cichorium intybus]|uniref:Uncharacterized protein n=1 Tax=Cichorium intybus TaxID=13427 RepID=A0ACB9E2G4_CICIN|nr:hypothetical protein L2E82_24999 [Cichorium intybus]
MGRRRWGSITHFPANRLQGVGGGDDGIFEGFEDGYRAEEWISYDEFDAIEFKVCSWRNVYKKFWPFNFLVLSRCARNFVGTRKLDKSKVMKPLGRWQCSGIYKGTKVVYGSGLVTLMKKETGENLQSSSKERNHDEPSQSMINKARAIDGEENPEQGSRVPRLNSLNYNNRNNGNMDQSP